MGATSGPGPILVFGSPRSGTTWLAKILDAHPHTFYSHEPDSALQPSDVPLFLPLEELECHREPLLRWVEELNALRATRITAKLPLFRKAYRNPVTNALWWGAIMASKAAPKRLNNFPVPAFASHAKLQRYPWLWKSIESLGRLGALARVLQNSKAILLVRHPCGVISSILRGESHAQFTSDVPASEDRGIFELLADTAEARARGLDVAAFFDMPPIERLTWRWALTNEKAMNDTAELSNVTLVRYEEICDDPIAWAETLLAAAGLPWHEQVEEFLRASVSSEQSAYYSVFKNPQQSASRWMKELEDSEVDAVMEVAKRTKPGRLFMT